MEIGQTVFPLNLIHTELDLAEGVIFVVLQVGERYLENAALQGVVRVLETTRSVDKGLSHA